MSVKSNGSRMYGEAHLHPVIVLCLFKPWHKAQILELGSNTLFTVRVILKTPWISLKYISFQSAYPNVRLRQNINRDALRLVFCTKRLRHHAPACSLRLQGSSIDSCCINLCCYNRWQRHQRACAEPDRMLDRKTQRSLCQRPRGPVDSKHINIPE